MINQSGKFRYYHSTVNVTQRNRHRGLRENIKVKHHRDPTKGDVNIYQSRAHSRHRVYYIHHNGEILTEENLHARRYTPPVFLEEGKPVNHISRSRIVYLHEGIIRKEKAGSIDEETAEESQVGEQQDAE